MFAIPVMPGIHAMMYGYQMTYPEPLLVQQEVIDLIRGEFLGIVYAVNYLELHICGWSIILTANIVPMLGNGAAIVFIFRVILVGAQPRRKIISGSNPLPFTVGTGS